MPPFPACGAFFNDTISLSSLLLLNEGKKESKGNQKLRTQPEASQPAKLTKKPEASQKPARSHQANPAKPKSFILKGLQKQMHARGKLPSRALRVSEPGAGAARVGFVTGRFNVKCFYRRLGP